MAGESRKWLITINNPLEHGFSHEEIINQLSHFKNLIYYCFCDEIGDECETLHTHLYFVLRSGVPWERIDRLFPNCHRDKVYGTSAESRAYVLKDGEKFHKDESGHYEYSDSHGSLHIGTNYSDTFTEFGTIPLEHQGKSKDYEIVMQMVNEGKSDAEIIDACPSAYTKIEDIQRVRSLYRDAAFVDSWRQLSVTYIFGATGSGKTRSVMEEFGYRNVYRVTDYKHPFDSYDGQDVLIFEEFRSGIKHGDMLNYLDGYPLLLPCRYFNRQACYTKVFIISNIPPTEQYTGVDPESRKAFFRRIHKVVEYVGQAFPIEYSSVDSWEHHIVQTTLEVF